MSDEEFFKLSPSLSIGGEEDVAGTARNGKEVRLPLSTYPQDSGETFSVS